VKRILFLVNGLGLGNSTRCHAVISWLEADQYIVDVGTSGNGLAYFSSVMKTGQVFPLRPLTYGQKKGRISFLKTIALLPLLLLNLLRNQISVHRALRLNTYDLVVIDSEYSVFLPRWLMRCPLVAINNSDIIVRQFRGEGVPGNLWFQFLVERMDFLFHRAVPDYVLSPSLSGEPDNAKFKHLPPFVRRELSPKPADHPPRKVLVMMSGSNFRPQFDFLREFTQFKNLEFDVLGVEGEPYGNLKFHGKIYQNVEFLNAADLVVINAGFSAVSEAVCLRKPCLVIPLPNHAEQFVNAQTVEAKGLGIAANEEEVPEKFRQLLKDYPQIRRAQESWGAGIAGACSAASFLKKLIQ